MARTERERMGLPLRAFMYTTDQIAYMLGDTDKHVRATMIHYEGREVTPRPHAKMLARNIAPEGEKPEWRVAENELIRWLRFKGFRIYARASVVS